MSKFLVRQILHREFRCCWLWIHVIVMTLCLLCYSFNQLKYSGGWARLIKLLGDSLDSSCLCNNYLTVKLLLEPLQDPCLFIRVSLAEYLCTQVASKLSCRWTRNGVRPLLPRWSKRGGRVGRGGCNVVLEQGIITLVSLYRNQTPWEYVNTINFMFWFNMTFVSPRLVSEVWNLPILNL